MKKILFAFLLFLSISVYAEDATEHTYSQNQFGAMVDELSADDIQPTNTPDCLNIYLDEQTGTVTRRKGSVKDNATLFPGNQWVRNLYDYKQIDGTEYKVVCTSASVLASSVGGIYNTILSGQDLTATFNFTTAKNYLYGTNGHVVFKSTGTTATMLTVENSTGIPQNATLIQYANNRLFFAGMPVSTTQFGIGVGPSTVIWSEINDPDNVQQFNYININVSDGDYITGIFAFNGNIYVTKRFSTWQLSETSPGVFQVSPISLNIGCLYQSTMQAYQNFPMWLSSRGVELYDGQFNLTSKPINNTVSNLIQLVTQQQNIFYNSNNFITATSTGTNISLPVGLNVLATNTKPQHSQTTSESPSHKQGFYYYYDTVVNRACLGISFGTKTPYILLEDSFGNIISTATLAEYAGGPDLWWYDFPIQLTLTANTTYVIHASTSFNINGYVEYDALPSDPKYRWNGIYGQWAPPQWEAGRNLTFCLYSASASYSSSIYHTSNFGSWGTFSSVDNISYLHSIGPASLTSISYYIKTSTAPDNFNIRPLIAVANGSIPNTSVGNYVQLIASFTVGRDAAFNSWNPAITNASLVYYNTSNMTPSSIVYKDRYYLSVIGNTGSSTNDTILIYDKNGQWVKHSGSVGSMCIYRGGLYYGDSTKGQVYSEDVNGVYSDDGLAYDSYYTTKMFDFREQDPINSLRNKVFNELWTRLTYQPSGTLDVLYQLDGVVGNWTKLYTLNMNEFNGISVQKINFQNYPTSKFIQLKFENNTATDYFNLKAYYLPYTVQPKE